MKILVVAMLAIVLVVPASAAQTPSIEDLPILEESGIREVLGHLDPRIQERAISLIGSRDNLTVILETGPESATVILLAEENGRFAIYANTVFLDLSIPGVPRVEVIGPAPDTSWRTAVDVLGEVGDNAFRIPPVSVIA